MDLNNIELNSFLVSDFYKTHLIESPVAKPAGKKPAKDASRIQYLGKNQKNISLLVNYATDVHLPDDQLNFLSSILQACRLNLGDVAIVNVNKQNISFDDLVAQLGCRNLLIFGVHASGIGLPELPEFTIQQYADTVLLASPAAEALNNNNAQSKQLKGKLWGCLKQMFTV